MPRKKITLSNYSYRVRRDDARWAEKNLMERKADGKMPARTSFTGSYRKSSMLSTNIAGGVGKPHYGVRVDKSKITLPTISFMKEPNDASE